MNLLKENIELRENTFILKKQNKDLIKKLGGKGLLKENKELQKRIKELESTININNDDLGELNYYKSILFLFGQIHGYGDNYFELLYINIHIEHHYKTKGKDRRNLRKTFDRLLKIEYPKINKTEANSLYQALLIKRKSERFILYSKLALL